jgi:ribosome biogenesis protein Tsr3
LNLEKGKKDIKIATSKFTYNITNKKPHQPNWEFSKVIVLPQAKQKIIAKQDIMYLHDKFRILASKWKRIVDVINSSNHPTLPKNDMACKDIWGT